MVEKSNIQLELDCLLNVPLNSYADDFIFIVNGKKYKTNRFVADLLSPKICNIHLTDQTLDTYIIQAEAKGDFTKILNLINFQQNEIEEEDIPFISEVIEALGNKTIKYNDQNSKSKITYDNVFPLLQVHEKCINFFSEKYNFEINFISSYFYDLCEQYFHEFSNLQLNTLVKIIENEHLQLNDEDQLLKFINRLYSSNHIYSVLYGHVNFVTVSLKAMNEFMKLFEPSEMNREIWNKISHRMNHEIQLNNNENDLLILERYNKKQLKFIENKPFSGVFDYFQMKTNGKIVNEINFSYSKTYRPDLYKAENVVYNEDLNMVFLTDNQSNSWIGFEFLNYSIIPTNYTIKSRNGGSNYEHPLNWVIEGSYDNDSWEILDTQNNCQFLNGPNLVHTFNIGNYNIDSKGFTHIRMRQTGVNSAGNNYLTLKSFELFGILLKKL